MFLSKREVRTKVIGTLGEFPFGGGDRNALAVKPRGRAPGKHAASDDVHVVLDGAAAALHVASTRLANDPRNINATSGGVAGPETLLECVGVDETVRNCTLC